MITEVTGSSCKIKEVRLQGSRRSSLEKVERLEKIARESIKGKKAAEERAERLLSKIKLKTNTESRLLGEIAGLREELAILREKVSVEAVVYEPWSTEEDKLLMRMYKADKSKGEIAKKLKARTENSVSCRISVLRKRHPEDEGLLSKAQKRKRLVKQFFDSGYSVLETSKATGISVANVSKIRSHNGLKSWDRWQDSEVVYLINNHNLPPRELAKRLGVTSTRVSSKLVSLRKKGAI